MKTIIAMLSVVVLGLSVAFALMLPVAAFPTALAAFAVLAVSIILSRRDERLNYTTLVDRLTELRERGIGPVGRIMWAVTKGQLALSPPEQPRRWEAAGPFSAHFRRTVEQFNETVDAVASLTDAAESLTAVPIRRLTYTGIDDFAHGQRAARLIGELTGGRGAVAVVAVDHTTNYSVLRERGFTTTLAAEFSGIRLAEVIYSGRNADRAVAGIVDLLSRDSSIDAVYQLEEASSTKVFAAIQQRFAPDRVRLVGHGRRREFLPFFESGHLDATLTQSPYFQGFNPVAHLYNALVSNWRPETARQFITPEVVDRSSYRDMLENPVDPTGRAELVEGTGDRLFKIVYLIPKDYDFWPPVKQGAEDAAQILAQRGTRVTVTLPDDPSNPYGLDQWHRMIRRAADNGADGIVVPVFSDRLIPTINEVADRGVLVATYNQEPASLREMVAGVREHARQVGETGQQLSASTEQSATAIGRVDGAVERLQEDAGQQDATGREIASAAERLDKTVGTLIEQMEQMIEQAAAIRGLAAEGASTVERGVSETDESVTAVSNTAGVVERLSGRSRDVQNLIQAIKDIGDRTHMLAMNAAIESARAGEAGRGFAVVADEIRSLSAQSQETSTRIEDQLATIVGDIEAIHSTVSTSMEYMHRNRDAANEIQRSFSDIATAVEENSHAMESVDRELEEIRTQITTVGSSATQFRDSLDALRRGLAEVVEANRDIAAAVDSMQQGNRALQAAASAQERMLRGFEV